ncbi:hypothetical protein [Haladaptatus salinisoli]|nr:hypothetical protein [Haladaptatus salinisoli]
MTDERHRDEGRPGTPKVRVSARPPTDGVRAETTHTDRLPMVLNG